MLKVMVSLASSLDSPKRPIVWSTLMFFVIPSHGVHVGKWERERVETEGVGVRIFFFK